MSFTDRKTIWLALALVGVILMNGCGSESPKTATPPKPAQQASLPPKPVPHPVVHTSDKIKIGFITNNVADAWVQTELRCAKAAAHKYGIDLIVKDTPTGAQVVSAIDDLETAGAQGIVVDTPDVKLGPEIVNKSESKNLKLCTVDDQLIGANGEIMDDIPFIGASNAEAGRAVGEALYSELIKRKWDPDETGAIIITFNRLPSAVERTNAIIQALEDSGFPREMVFAVGGKNITLEEGGEAARKVIKAHPNISRWIVSSINDKCVMGAIREFEQMKLGPKNVIGIGIGGRSCAWEFKKKKPTGFFASYFVSPRRQGFESVESIYKWIKDGSEPQIETGVQGIMINRSNYKRILTREGLMKGDF